MRARFFSFALCLLVISGVVCSARAALVPNEPVIAIEIDKVVSRLGLVGSGTNESRILTFKNADIAGDLAARPARGAWPIVELVRHIKGVAEQELGQAVDKGVITHSPAFNHIWTREDIPSACAHAGLEVLRVVNRHTAAIIAHSLHDLYDEVFVAVVDCSPPDLEVNIVEIDTGVVETFATAMGSIIGLESTLNTAIGAANITKDGVKHIVLVGTVPSELPARLESFFGLAPLADGAEEAVIRGALAQARILQGEEDFILGRNCPCGSGWGNEEL